MRDAPGELTASALEARAKAFTVAATAYIQWMDKVVSMDAPVANASELYGILAHLQAAALELPPIKLSNEPGEVPSLNEADASNNLEEAEKAWAIASTVTSLLSLNDYCTVFDALDPDDRAAIMKNLHDDLGDIYSELKQALTVAKIAPLVDAVWQWRFLYYNHSGRHLVHAQAAIYSYLASSGRFLSKEIDKQR